MSIYAPCKKSLGTRTPEKRQGYLHALRAEKQTDRQPDESLVRGQQDGQRGPVSAKNATISRYMGQGHSWDPGGEKPRSHKTVDKGQD